MLISVLVALVEGEEIKKVAYAAAIALHFADYCFIKTHKALGVYRQQSKPDLEPYIRHIPDFAQVVYLQ